MNITMLKTALVNTKKLNKALQDMLHNMDKFFERLLSKQSYGELLEEHLEGYVEEVVNKKYHILKTSDNFYIYKMDIKRCLKEMREDDAWIGRIRARQELSREKKGKEPEGFYRRRQEEDVLDLIDQIERGFDDIEHRIANMDREHSKYVRATVTRLNYLLSGESDTKGLVIQLLNRMAEDDYEEVIQKTGEKMNLSLVEILSEKSLYKRRKNRKDFVSQMAPEEEVDDLDKEDVLRLNRIKRRFSKKQIEEFIEEHIEKDVLDTEKLSLTSEEDFEKLILAYDLSTRKNSKYKTLEEDAETIEKNGYRYPALKFVRRHL